MGGRRAVVALVIGLGAAAAGCGASPTPSGEEGPLRYVALGDSYTIGTSVPADESWPVQMAARVDGIELVANLAANGYTSADLIIEQLPSLAEHDPQFVTLLIGVNDVVQGVPLADYEVNVDFILQTLVDSLGADRVVCLATPDYTVTPQGAAFGDPEQQRAEIVRFNEALANACEAYGAPFVPDIFEISQAAADDPSLVASDGLHPSGAQYALWVDAIEPVVEELVSSSEQP